MNFTQLPATKSEKSGSNQLVLAITNRVKIFYRPQGIEGTPGETAQKMTFSLSGKKIKVTNSAGYFAVVRRASLVINGREIKANGRAAIIRRVVTLSPGVRPQGRTSAVSFGQ